jgi:hypothetical protein
MRLHAHQFLGVVLDTEDPLVWFGGLDGLDDPVLGDGCHPESATESSDPLVMPAVDRQLRAASQST